MGLCCQGCRHPRSWQSLGLGCGTALGRGPCCRGAPWWWACTPTRCAPPGPAHNVYSVSWQMCACSSAGAAGVVHAVPPQRWPCCHSAYVMAMVMWSPLSVCQYQQAHLACFWRDGGGLWQSVRRALPTCSIHSCAPQATDAISDFAVQFGKPHAIVPCCVFPRSFPHRRLPPAPTLHTQPQAATADAHGSLLPEAGEPASARPNDAEGHLTAGALGSTVTLHHELVEYLRLRAGAAGQVEYLSFEGMNQVVFNTPEVV